ncbi:nucleoporin-like protein 2 [Galendromus occidentalis]|uniref:Nucleoporin NUP42 n=1 Tax=Galendromus occidentalis TaxID=34638 RepID=A0AAJ7P9U6_9ACAR|nr:nucleoporin-like protein 2 [Galendromus occidentalis]
MTVCRYYRNGYCRNGFSCRFEHTSPREPLLNAPTYHPEYSTGYGPRANNVGPRQSWQAQEHQYHHQQSFFQQQQPSVVDQIIADIALMLRGKQYLYSCIPGRQPHLNCKNLSDLSPEEIRVKFLEFQATNNVERFMSEMSAHRLFVEGILHQISRNPSMLDDVQPPLARPMFHTPPNEPSLAASPQSSSFSAPLFGATSATSPSGNNAGSIFEASPPPSHQIHQPASGMDVAQDAVKPRMLFGKSVQNDGGLFDTNRAAQSLFAQAPQIAPTGFQMNAPPQAAQQIMNQQVGFPVSSTPPIIQSVSGSPALLPFGASDPPKQITAPPSHQSAGDDGVYTQLMDMSPEDLAAFQNRAFTIAGIPLLPPAREHYQKSLGCQIGLCMKPAVAGTIQSMQKEEAN